MKPPSSAAGGAPRHLKILCNLLQLWCSVSLLAFEGVPEDTLPSEKAILYRKPAAISMSACSYERKEKSS